MCGRFANSETIPAMRSHFAAEGTEIAWTASWNITPTWNNSVLNLDQRSRRLGGDGCRQVRRGLRDGNT